MNGASARGQGGDASRSRAAFCPAAVPAQAGIGLRAPHVGHVLQARPRVAWLEVHSENYFAPGGAAPAALERLRAAYPLSLHGVGLALGSAAPLDRGHLARLARLVARVEPGLVSEHLAWGRALGRHFNDLLPMPYTEEALALVASRVAQVQEALGRRILVENVSAYWTFPESTIAEAQFLQALARRTGCGLLLDVNNAYVNARNHGFDAAAWLREIPRGLVEEIHLGGFEDTGSLLVDTHGRRVDEAVWRLYALALERFGPVPTLIEWDTDIPEFRVLQEEAARAQRALRQRDALAA